MPGLPNDIIFLQLKTGGWLKHGMFGWFFSPHFWGADKIFILDTIQYGAGVGSFLGDTTVPLEPTGSQSIIIIRGGPDKPLGAAWHDAFSRKMLNWRKLGSKIEKMPANCTILPLEG